MSVQSITDKIIADAQKEATAVRVEAEERVKQIEQETKRAVAQLEAESKAVLQKEQVHVRSVTRSLVKQANMVKLQREKRHQLDVVYNKAYERLCHLDSDAYTHFWSTVLREAAITPEAVSNVLAPEKRQTETQALLAQFGITAEIAFVPDMIGGLIVNCADRQYNLSVERVFPDLVAKREMEIADILFHHSS